MRIQLNSETFTEITSPTSGTIQNISPTTPVEIASTEEAGTGIVLQPFERIEYSDSTSVYARSLWEDDDAAYIVAEPFKRAAGGGGGSYTLPAATASKLGGVKIGSNVTVQSDGTISVAAPYVLPAAASNTLGGVKIGSNVSIDANGVISVAAPYSLPTAAADTLGGVKVGSGLSITDGVLSATGGGGSISYSTTEQTIGTWIDGKPLYQITFQDTMPSVSGDGAAADKTIDISSLHVNYVAHLYGILRTSTRILPIPSVNDPMQYLFRYTYITKEDTLLAYFDTLFVRESQQVFSQAPCYITLQYTKTTD